MIPVTGTGLRKPYCTRDADSVWGWGLALGPDNKVSGAMDAAGLSALGDEGCLASQPSGASVGASHTARDPP